MVLGRLQGSAYRDGRLVCARAVVTVLADAPSGRRVRVRFVDGVDQQLRAELERLMARRGAFAAWLAERLDPVQIVGWDATHGLQWRLEGRLQRPAAQYWPPADAEFWLRETTDPTSLPGSRRADEATDGQPRPPRPPHNRR